MAMMMGARRMMAPLPAESVLGLFRGIMGWLVKSSRARAVCRPTSAAGLSSWVR